LTLQKISNSPGVGLTRKCDEILAMTSFSRCLRKRMFTKRNQHHTLLSSRGEQTLPMAGATLTRAIHPTTWPRFHRPVALQTFLHRWHLMLVAPNGSVPGARRGSRHPGPVRQFPRPGRARGAHPVNKMVSQRTRSGRHQGITPIHQLSRTGSPRCDRSKQFFLYFSGFDLNESGIRFDILPLEIGTRRYGRGQ
jgi:hypothetical protein